MDTQFHAKSHNLMLLIIIAIIIVIHYNCNIRHGILRSNKKVIFDAVCTVHHPTICI